MPKKHLDTMSGRENHLIGFFFLALQGERVAELILNHARANECPDVPQFKKEMSELVDHALSSTLSLGKVFLGFVPDLCLVILFPNLKYIIFQSFCIKLVYFLSFTELVVIL